MTCGEGSHLGLHKWSGGWQVPEAMEPGSGWRGNREIQIGLTTLEEEKSVPRLPTHTR